MAVSDIVAVVPTELPIEPSRYGKGTGFRPAKIKSAWLSARSVAVSVSRKVGRLRHEMGFLAPVVVGLSCPMAARLVAPASLVMILDEKHCAAGSVALPQQRSVGPSDQHDRLTCQTAEQGVDRRALTPFGDDRVSVLVPMEMRGPRAACRIPVDHCHSAAVGDGSGGDVAEHGANRVAKFSNRVAVEAPRSGRHCDSSAAHLEPQLQTGVSSPGSRSSLPRIRTASWRTPREAARRSVGTRRDRWPPRSPDVTVPPVAGQFPGDIDVVVGTARQTMESSSSGVRTTPSGVIAERMTRPLDPSAMSVEADGRVAGAERSDVVGTFDDRFERCHQLPADAAALPGRIDSDTFDVSRSQRLAVVHQSTLNDRRVTDDRSRRARRWRASRRARAPNRASVMSSKTT